MGGKNWQKKSVCISFHRQGVTWGGKRSRSRLDPVYFTDTGLAGEEGYFLLSAGQMARPRPNNMLCAALEAEGYRVVCNHNPDPTC